MSVRSICVATVLLAFSCVSLNEAMPYPGLPPRQGEVQEPPEPVATPAPPNSVSFLDRQIELEPFLAGFPYERFMLDLKAKRALFVERKDKHTLKLLKLGYGAGAELANPDFSKLETVSDIDWSTRSLWGADYHAASDSYFLHADNNNDEKMNIWRLKLSQTSGQTSHLEQITSSDYVYSFGFDQEQKRLAYIDRRGTKAPFRSCLKILAVDSLGSGDALTIVCDSSEVAFSWGTPRFSPDGRYLVVKGLVNGERSRSQLYRVDLKASKPKLVAITDTAVRRKSASMLEHWVDDRTFLFLANDDGFVNLYRHSLKTRRTMQLTRFREDIHSAKFIDAGVFLTRGTPAGTTVELIDPKSGTSLGKAGVPGTTDIADTYGDTVVWSHRSPTMPFEAIVSQVRVEGGKLEWDNRKWLQLDAKLLQAKAQCTARAVRIATHDIDPATGEVRLLHAFVLEPKTPLPVEQRLILLRSFYGGDNDFTTYDHVMCAAGLTLVSPAVRGSSGFGSDFSALNDGDLGGDEIVDLFHVARFAQREFSVSSARIGVYGRSHGGYATMRAMTFPDSGDAARKPYPFGFGMGEAGFSDIVAFHDYTNIPDWVVSEAGDPKVPVDRARLTERSPIHSVDRLSAPIFLLHGEKDWRVPAEGSRLFAQKAKALGKDVTYVEVPGQGHRVQGLARQVEAYQARFDFLAKMATAENVELPQPQPQ